ncbi:MAG: hypothetical protein IT378_21505 [Sandaracinaceae bacterium]|nr:hypothetical protein [Sandaracinaceae bacterium]
MTWRTRILLLLAAGIATLMTWLEVRDRPARPRPEPAPEAIEVEIVAPE